MTGIGYGVGDVMTDEQRKWYLMGVNDTEAGRLVTTERTTEQIEAEAHRAVWEQVESLREQLAAAQEEIDEDGSNLRRALAAEAKLAEAEANVDKWRDRALPAEHRLAEVEKELADRIKKDLRISGALQDRMDRARELAEERPSQNGGWVRNLKEIARLLSGDE